MCRTKLQRLRLSLDPSRSTKYREIKRLRYSLQKELHQMNFKLVYINTTKAQSKYYALTYRDEVLRFFSTLEECIEALFTMREEYYKLGIIRIQKQLGL